MGTYVFDFAEGDRDQKDLLGGKGANLAEMTNLGLPVPPGFTISTEACRAYLEASKDPDGLTEEVTEHLRSLEDAMGRRLGDADDPLLVSVRSGAKFSMPGMMETVLNVGLNDRSVQGLAAKAGGDERFAFDSYRRLLQMFGSTVLGIDAHVFHEPNTAFMAPTSWSRGSCGKSSPVSSRMIRWYVATSSRKASASRSTSASAPRCSLAASSSFANVCASMSSTVAPYICSSRR